VIANIDASPIINVDLGNYGQVIQHVPGRVAPYDTYASTAALWALHPTDTTTPSPVFTFSSTVPSGGTPAGSVAIPFSQTSNVQWIYHAATGLWQRYYGLLADNLSDGSQITAANVVVQVVHVTYGPWLENDEGGLEVQAQLSGTSGTMHLFRNGQEFTGTWQRAAPASATVLEDSQGQPLSLQPGNTWVELVPDTIPVTTTAPPPTTTTVPTKATTTTTKKSS
jgi:hypothetical protein